MKDTTKKYGGVAGLLAGGLLAGGLLAGSLTANAATPSPTPSTGATAPANPNAGDPSKSQRPDETLLTGDTAAKVKAAALAKYPGATVVRVETDSDGVYEAHLTKADGTPVTVEVDKAFAVTGDEAGGFGGHGGPRDGDIDG
jgi:hypothetical protein